MIVIPGEQVRAVRGKSVSVVAVFDLEPAEHRLSSARRYRADRALDVLGSFALLTLMLPSLLVLSLAVAATSRGGVFYRQIRVGHHGQLFTILKFRTMHAEGHARRPELQSLDDGNGMLFKIRSDPRVTAVGKVLRRFSLDELPQLLNVLRGEMSLVGPRPPLPGEVARYGSDVHRRLLVRPGLTGLWQINGRSDLSWDESIRLDLRYVENWSLSMDLLILWRTLAAVVTGQGAY
jgi:lipopolysaccharide/colanic/teichoic acid biosynthesis glycosyltransferase